MDLSEVLFYLELMKKYKRKPTVTEMNLMLYFLKNYEEVKEFYNKFIDLGLKMPKNYEINVLIHFFEDLEDTFKLKEVIIAKADKRVKSYYQSLFTQQILLSKSKEQAFDFWQESKKYGLNLEEVWVSRYDSLWQIKNSLESWRRDRHSFDFTYLPKMIETYNQLKNEYFAELSLPQLKHKLLGEKLKVLVGDIAKERKTIVFSRGVLIKEFAKRVAGGVCQLCENGAPFLDKEGNPFLEVHHIEYLSQGGSDTIDNVVALCPNCHRRMHLLELEEDINRIKSKALSNIGVL
jgi:predicted HNH restriction endonuclease